MPPSGPAAARPAEDYWSRPAAETLERLNASAGGLSSSDAAARLRQYGPNSVEGRAEQGPLRLLLRQFENPLVLILLFGAVVSLALKEWVDAWIILGVVAGSCGLGFVQENKASRAMAILKQRLALTAQVLRDGKLASVPADSIVPGDVAHFSAGTLIPADGVILQANDFLVSEAALTGESFPVEKQPGVVAADAALAQRTNCVFLGGSVRSGSAQALIVATGRSTAFGAVAARLKAKPPETEFARGVRKFGYLLIRVMIVMVLFVLTVNQLMGRPFMESLLFAVALAVGISPELLPAIITVTLSAGARAMAAEGVIVRRLEAIENLGGMDVLCTDKTGTLTSGVIELSGAVDWQGRDCPDVKRLAVVNASLETGIDNPIDEAIRAAGKAGNLDATGWRKLGELPYDFQRKRLTVIAAGPEGPMAVSKGAVANVLEVCTTVRGPAGDAPLDPAARKTIDDWFQARGAAGFRVLGVATRAVDAAGPYGHEVESGMRLEGFLEFYDPPKTDAARVLGELADLGIRVKIISGDNRHVCAYVAEAVGLKGVKMLTGPEIASLKDEALWRQADDCDLFAEIDPQQKERIVRALQRTGHAVGYMGDGIDDAPALHAADVGISVDQAVDVARESADVILLKRDLEVLRRGVLEGRRTFANTLKYICLAVSSTFGNMISMALATPLLPFMPLLAKQILVNNFLSDLPAITLSADRVDAERLTTPQRWDVGQVQRIMLVFGLTSTVFDFITFGVLLLVFHAGQGLFQTAWFVLSLLTELVALMVLRTRRPVWESAPGRLLAGACAVVGLIALALPFTGPVARDLGFVAPPLSVLAAALAIVGGYAIALEIAKRLVFGRPSPVAG